MRVKVFIDTNVLMDVLLGDRASSEASGKIFNAVREGRLEGLLTTQTLIDAAYVLEKSRLPFQEQFLKLGNFFNIENLDWFDIPQACLQGRGDFEDDAQYARAEESCCDAIITNDRQFRNRYEARNPHIGFYTPEEFIRKITE